MEKLSNPTTSTLIENLENLTTSNSSSEIFHVPMFSDLTDVNISLTSPTWTSTPMVNKDDFLAALSRNKAESFWPVIVFIGLLMVAGLIGNALVLYVHIFKFKRSSTRTFVISLAVFDVLSCAIAMPGEILDVRFSYDYPSAVSCKLLRSITSFCSVASGFTLMAVSFDRYRRICHPLKRQMGHKRSAFFVGLASAMSVFVSWPLALISGFKTVSTADPDVNGRECSVNDAFRKAKTFPLMYTGILFLTFLVAFLTMTVFYSLIWRQVSKQNAFRKNATSRCRNISSNSDSEMKCNRDRKISTVSNAEDNGYSFENESDYSISVPSKRGLSRKSSWRSNRVTKKQPDQQRTKKITLMLFLISLTFVLSFLPHLILKSLQAINKRFVQNLSLPGEVTYNIFVRSFLINSVSNAFIYGFCSPRFRKECSDLFGRALARRRNISLNSSSVK